MKTKEFTCVGTKEIKRKDGSGSVYKSYLLFDPIESGVDGQQTSVFWGEELVPGTVYEGVLGYNRRGEYGIVDIID